MAWFPVGPAFVFAPRNEAYSRLSRRNEKGRQTLVTDIAVDPTYNPAVPNSNATLYIVETAGLNSNAWRSSDDGATWTPIADTLRAQFANRYLDPNCIAIHPLQSNIVYLGAASWGFFVSTNRGALGSWSGPTRSGVEFRKLLVDTRSAGTAATTVIYAATDQGLLRSATGGSSWDPAPVLPGEITALAGHFDPAAGTAHVYAVAKGASGPALHFATNPSVPANWTNLTAAGIGLPSQTTLVHDNILVDLCRRNPERAYAWLTNLGGTVGIYTTAMATGSWTQVSAASPPSGLSWLHLFAVAPSSPGDGLTDVLAFGEVELHRSVDAGRTWTTDAVWLHVDHRAIAFAPVDPAPGTVPVTYVGCDGGLGKSTQFANPKVAIDVAPSTFNETEARPADTPTWQNCNRGRQSVDCLGYAGVRGQPALGYIASWDSGLKGGHTSRTWRGLHDRDMNGVAAAAGPDSVTVWGTLDLSGTLTRWLDRGEFTPPKDTTTVNGVSRVAYPVAVDLDGNCLFIDVAGFIGRVGPTGAGTEISQDFTGVGRARGVAVDPTNRDILYCLTGSTVATAPPATSRRVWTTAAASTASAATVWTEIATGRPRQTALSIVVSASGVAYAGMSFYAGEPALFALTAAGWIAQSATGAPPFGGVSWLTADPRDGNVLYAAMGAEFIYRLTLSAGTWAWQAIPSAGLPDLLRDLRAVDVGSQAAPKTVLRAATTTRGVFESDANPTAVSPAIDLYVRDNFLDTAWTTPSPDGATNPYVPQTKVWHWECADIKLDQAYRAPLQGYVLQTTPEWDESAPLDPIMFDELREYPLLGGRAARLHVQVHNRASAPASGVSVWTIYCPASAPLPRLDATASGTPFAFWNQFTPAGTIVPALPADSPWKSVGPPVVLSGLDADHPQVASWGWASPQVTWPSGYSFVTFVHSAAAPIGETTRFDVDAITPTNRQVGQKTVSVRSSNPPPPKKPDFHEVHLRPPRRFPYCVDLDLGGVPRGIEVSFRTTVESPEVSGASRAGWLRETFTDLVQRIRVLWRGRRADRFERALYVSPGGVMVKVCGIGRPATLELAVRTIERLEPGREYRFSILLREGEEVRGGATYVLRTPGSPTPPHPDEPPEPEEEEPRELLERGAVANPNHANTSGL